MDLTNELNEIENSRKELNKNLDKIDNKLKEVGENELKDLIILVKEHNKIISQNENIGITENDIDYLGKYLSDLMGLKSVEYMPLVYLNKTGNERTIYICQKGFYYLPSSYSERKSKLWYSNVINILRIENVKEKIINKIKNKKDKEILKQIFNLFDLTNEYGENKVSLDKEKEINQEVNINSYEYRRNEDKPHFTNTNTKINKLLVSPRSIRIELNKNNTYDDDLNLRFLSDDELLRKNNLEEMELCLKFNQELKDLITEFNKEFTEKIKDKLKEKEVLNNVIKPYKVLAEL